MSKNDERLESYTKSLSAPSTVKTYDEPGKLRKQCQDCNKYVHAKCAFCACGYEFKKSSVKENPSAQEEPIDDMLRNYINGLHIKSKVIIIYAAIGRPHFLLESYDEDSVHEYCDKTITEGLKLGKLYYPSVIKAWLRNTVPVEKQAEALSFVNSWVRKVCNETIESGT